MSQDRKPEQPKMADQQSVAHVARALARHNQELVKLLEELLPPPDPGFVPTQFQQDILEALSGRALRTDALAAKVGNRRGLFKDPGGVPELIEEGLVSHHKRLGYYRPDKPPADLGD